MANYLNLEDLILNQSALIGDNGFFICIDMSPTYQYDKENKCYTDKRVGTKVTVVIPSQKYARLTVQLPMGFDELLVPNAKLRFEGFSLRFYREFNSGDFVSSAKADKVIVVK